MREQSSDVWRTNKYIITPEHIVPMAAILHNYTYVFMQIIINYIKYESYFRNIYLYFF